MTVQIEIADLASELADPHQHREPRGHTWSATRNKIQLPDHITTQPGLIAQLYDAVVNALVQEKATGGGGTSSGYAPVSTPPLQFEALASYLAIVEAAAAWLGELGVRQRATVEENIRALAGATYTGEQGIRLRNDLRRWRNQAAVMTGWQQPLYRPRAECPLTDCGKRDVLRVNLVAKTAVCLACDAYWDPATIGVLGRHIAESKATRISVKIRSGITGHGGWSGRATASA